MPAFDLFDATTSNSNNLQEQLDEQEASSLLVKVNTSANSIRAQEDMSVFKRVIVVEVEMNIASSSHASSSTDATSILPPPLPPYILPCEFLSTGCEKWFYPTEIERWIRHSLSHFPRVPLPSKAICTFCDDEVFESRGDLESNWRRRMGHIASHFQSLQREDDQRPDFWVLNHMYKHGLMSDEDWEYARGYTESPRGFPGIVSRKYQASEALRKQEKDSRMRYDLDREDRMRKRNKEKHRGSRTHH